MQQQRQQPARASWLDDGLHPTHRRLRDGWGTRAFWADWRRKGNGNGKGNGHGNGKDNGRGEMRGFFAPLRMTSKKKGNDKSCGCRLTDGLHPTHCKRRDGWGTRFVVAGQKRNKDNSRSPSGMTTEGKTRTTAKAFSAPCGRGPSPRMNFCGPASIQG